MRPSSTGSWSRASIRPLDVPAEKIDYYGLTLSGSYIFDDSSKEQQKDKG